MTATTDMRDPHRGQAMTSNSWTLATSRAQAVLRESAPTYWSFGASGSAGSPDAFLPYRFAGAREARGGRCSGPP